MISSLYLLFTLAIFASLFNLTKSKTQNIILFCFLVLMILLAGFREIGVDQDSIGYVRYYYAKDIYKLAEPTFVYISIFVKYCCNNVQIVFLIYAILGVSLKFLAVSRLTELWYLTLVIYVGRFYMFYDLNVIRAGVSCSLFLLSIIPLVERKFFHFFFIVLLATLFHYSALLLFPIWFITNDPLTKWGKYFLYLIIPISYLIHFGGIDLIASVPIPLIEQKLKVYAAVERMGKENMSGVNVFNLFQLVKCFVFYYLLYFYDYLLEKNKYFTILMKIYVISLIALPLLSTISLIALRISALFGIVEMILIPFIYYTLKPKIVSKVIVIMIGVVYFLYSIYVAELVYW